MPAELIKMGTRFFPVMVFEMACQAQTKELEKFIGLNFNHYIVRFDGRKMDSFRTQKDVSLLTAAINDRLKNNPEFLSTFKEYIKAIDMVVTAMKSEELSLEQAFVQTASLYPLSVIASIASNYLMAKVEFDNSPALVAVCELYRKKTDELLAIFSEYIKIQTNKDQVSDFMCLARVESTQPARQTLEQGFVYYNGEFLSVSWVQFLQKYNFVFEEAALAETEVLHGVPAFPGIVQGKVNILFSPTDFVHFQDGSIVVTPMTTPLFMPLFKRVLAIITDEGGITCHAAIVAREMKKPCIVGTKIATKILRDGDLVEVDANKGLVRRLNKK